MNIGETAKETGIASFAVDTVNGAIELSASGLPADLSLKYARAGYDIAVNPVFALSLNADRRRTPDDLVYLATVQVEGDALKSHRAARAFVDDLLVQFKQGKWSRYIAPGCPAVSGRSSLLNAAGAIDTDGCSIDPAYVIADDDWKSIFTTRQTYEWIGNGVLARLTVGFAENDQGLAYTIFVDFEDHATKAAMEYETEMRERQEGDAKGWNASVNAERARQANRTKVIMLEQNAVQRGDTLVARQ